MTKKFSKTELAQRDKVFRKLCKEMDRVQNAEEIIAAIERDIAETYGRMAKLASKLKI